MHSGREPCSSPTTAPTSPPRRFGWEPPGHAGPALVLTVWQGIESVAFGPVGMNASLVARDRLRHRGRGEADGDGGGRDLPGRRLRRRADHRDVERTAWSTIIEVAIGHDVGLIVLGSHGRTGIDYVLKGSVATAVSQHAKRPVMIVPARPGLSLGPAARRRPSRMTPTTTALSWSGGKDSAYALQMLRERAGRRPCC